MLAGCRAHPEECTEQQTASTTAPFIPFYSPLLSHSCSSPNLLNTTLPLPLPLFGLPLKYPTSPVQFQNPSSLASRGVTALLVWEVTWRAAGFHLWLPHWDGWERPFRPWRLAFCNAFGTNHLFGTVHLWCSPGLSLVLKWEKVSTALLPLSPQPLIHLQLAQQAPSSIASISPSLLTSEFDIAGIRFDAEFDAI